MRVEEPRERDDPAALRVDAIRGALDPQVRRRRICVANRGAVELEPAKREGHRLRIAEDLRRARVREVLPAPGETHPQEQRSVRGEEEAHEREDRDERAALARAAAVRHGSEPDVGDEGDDSREHGRHRHEVRVAIPDVRDLVREHCLELALRHRPQQARRDADIARRRPQPGCERVRCGIVDDPQLGRDRQPGADGDVLDEPAEGAQLVRADRLRVRDPRDQAARPDDPEHCVEERDDERDDAERDVERESHETREHDEEKDEADDDDAAAQPVPPDLLLERHGAGTNETCGTAVSPSAEKNSFAPKPSGFATSTHGMLWIAVK